MSEKIANNRSRPLLSIIIPVFNTAGYIDQCLESILDGCEFNIEIILIDDGSTDSSSIKCDQWVLSDSRVRCYHQKNQGVSSARNTGINNSQGDYLWFCDSDDRVVSGATTAICKTLEKYSPDILCFGAIKVDENDVEIGVISSPSDNFSASCGPIQCGDELYLFSHVFKRSQIRDIRFDVSLNMCEDRLFAYRVFDVSADNILVVGDLYYRYLFTRSDSAVNTLSLSDDIASVSVHEYILKREIELNRPTEAYEVFIQRSISLLARIVTEECSYGLFHDLRKRVLRYDSLRHCLRGAVLIKYMLLYASESIFITSCRILRLVKRQ